ncbi:uncharacterized protein BP01DRAFT_422276 [Aspergillus saccharolyticus JOP 1030-1]|uniref:Uncharacterized protein n=1 Tax=Aspergillus saccharolyticus JOP 1030-1 TaxID=1450539 RepID=A0A318ZKG7_9EURO|nr:hypothetical protein BP01DRAFT_422276 [Aspergillus saccharolyticus JOP 1030-1]PYH46884.1 hypothetical protein BP01DRAFT_422276 [Aspergillus saccharolyticus JOP 1030-1]
MDATTGVKLSATGSENDLRNENSSKAYKILGAADIPSHDDYSKQDDKRRSKKPSFRRSPDVNSQKSGGSFVPFPTAASEATLPPAHLRVRASSPLLGLEYRTEDTALPAVPTASKKLHLTGSSSALFSYFSSKESTTNSSLAVGTATTDLGKSEDRKSGPGQNAEPRHGPKQPKGSMKDSRRKMRPSRIDLSLLFPKPKATAAPLLSPQRMVDSPSPISVIFEQTAINPQESRTHYSDHKLTKTPARPRASILKSTDHHSPEPSTTHKTKSSDWLNPSFEKTMSTNEMDIALQRYSDREHNPQVSERSHAQFPNRDRLVMKRDPRSTEQESRDISSNSSVSEWSRESYLSPKTCLPPRAYRASSAGRDGANLKNSMPKKTSKSTLRTVDLNHSSVLCLSSSEDEEEEEDEHQDYTKGHSDASARNSVATYGEFEPEICTASAAHTTKGTLRSVDRPISGISRGSQYSQRSQSIRRNPSMSSAGRSSTATRKSQSRRSSGIPTISEPEIYYGNPTVNYSKPVPRTRSSMTAQKETNRRSRVIAVTRQEEHLLEAMRQRQGKITPSLFNEVRVSEPDQGSMLSVPSRDSFYGTDMSFLRLSPGLSARSGQTGSSTDREGLVFQSSSSDGEQKTVYSFPSPRTSLAYSESLPSPVTSGASPLTPTHPSYRLSTLPTQKPTPMRPAPAVPKAQRRHSRRRTDSSEAIILEESNETPQSEDFPLWAIRWQNENGNMTAVH